MGLHELYETVLTEQLGLDARRCTRGFAVEHQGLRATVRVDPAELAVARVHAWFEDPGLAEPDVVAAVNRVNRRCVGACAFRDDDGAVCLRVEGVMAAAGTLPPRDVLAAVLARMLAALAHAASVLVEAVTLARLDPDGASGGASGQSQADAPSGPDAARG